MVKIIIAAAGLMLTGLLLTSYLSHPLLDNARLLQNAVYETQCAIVISEVPQPLALVPAQLYKPQGLPWLHLHRLRSHHPLSWRQAFQLSLCIYEPSYVGYLFCKSLRRQLFPQFRTFHADCCCWSGIDTDGLSVENKSKEDIMICLFDCLVRHWQYMRQNAIQCLSINIPNNTQYQLIVIIINQEQLYFNMQTNSPKKSLLDPYKTIGLFTSSKISLSQSSPYSLTTATNNSYKVYSQSLSLKVVSPPFSSKVNAAISYNEFTYVRITGFVVKMKYHHVVKRWEVEGDGGEHCTLMRFEGVILVGEKKCVWVIDQETQQVEKVKVDCSVNNMIHPTTYINKVLLSSKKGLLLLNPLTQKQLYSYPNLSSFLESEQLTLIHVQPTYIIDIISLSLSDGTIAFLNLKKDLVIFKLKQKMPAICVGFCREESFMASGDQAGNVMFWDLNTKKILAKMEGALPGRVDSLVFMPGYPLITCASSSTNNIKQLRYSLEDSKILSLHRQRQGIQCSLTHLSIHSNNDITMHTGSESMSLSLHSQCNSYLLPLSLDSSHPYHILSSNFNVMLYKHQTNQNTINIHDYARIGKITCSQKYSIVATKGKIIKLSHSGVVCEAKISEVEFLVMNREVQVLLGRGQEIIVLGFTGLDMERRVELGGRVKNITTNMFNTMFSFENITTNCLEIYSTQTVTPARIHPTSPTLCLAFTSNNHFLLSSHSDRSLRIYSILNSQLYKQYQLEFNLIWIGFTPDNQFMLGIYEGSKEVCVWVNYIGRISSSRDVQPLPFQPFVRLLEEDFRETLMQQYQQQQQQKQHNEVDVLDTIEDADDGIPSYDFTHIGKWLPLVYYDELKARNTPQTQSDIPSLPFFLDFKSLSAQKDKLKKELQQQAQMQKASHLQNQDKHLHNKSNQILLTQSSTPQEYLQTINSLKALSIAEIDYQLRTFLLNPSNNVIMVGLMKHLMDVQMGVSMEIANVLVNRALILMGNGVLDEQLSHQMEELLEQVEKMTCWQKGIIDRSVAVVDKY